MAWNGGTFYHDIGTYSPSLSDAPVFPWQPERITVGNSLRARSGDVWSYPRFEYGRLTLRFMDVGSTCVHRIGSLLSAGTDGFYYGYASALYHVNTIPGYVFAPRSDVPDAYTFDLQLETLGTSGIEIQESD